MKRTLTLYDYTTDSDSRWLVHFNLWEGEVEIIEIQKEGTDEVVSGFEAAERFGNVVTLVTELLESEEP